MQPLNTSLPKTPRPQPQGGGTSQRPKVSKGACASRAPKRLEWQRFVHPPEQATKPGDLKVVPRKLDKEQEPFDHLRAERIRDLLHLNFGRPNTWRSKERYLKIFNQVLSPRLLTEEAWMQVAAMKLTYMPLEVGDEIKVHIRQDILANPTVDYARSYKVDNVLVDYKHGCVAFRLVPDASWQHSHASIILFRGTHWRNPAQPPSQLPYPTGIRADLDPRGIAYEAFANNASQLIDWVAQDNVKQCATVISGHSLGGTFALRLAAALPHELAKEISVITFQTPGLDAETANKIGDDVSIRFFANPYDFVCRFGSKLPANGQFFWMIARNPKDDLSSHALPQLGLADLLRVPAHIQYAPRIPGNLHSPFLEGMRRTLSLAWQAWLRLTGGQ